MNRNFAARLTARPFRTLGRTARGIGGGPTVLDVGASGGTAVAAHTARSSLILAVRSVLVFFIQAAGSLVLARKLVAPVYADAALALSLVGAVRFFGDLGLSNALVQKGGPVRLERSSQQMALFVQLLVAGGCFGILVVVAPLMAAATRTGTTATLLTSTIALTLVLDAFGTPGQAQLLRSLDFTSIGKIDVTCTIALYAAQITGLLLGLGVWSIAIAQLSRSVTGSLLAMLRGGMVLPRWHHNGMHLIRRGLAFQLTPILAGLIGSLSPLIVGIALGPTRLGYWAWATILSGPIMQLIAVTQTAGMPALARLRNMGIEVGAAANFILRVSTLSAACLVGTVLGLVRPIVHIIFSPHWLGATPAVIVFTLGVLPAAAALSLSAVVEARGRAMMRFTSALAGTIVGLGILFPMSLRWGIAGAAVASAIVPQLLDVTILARLEQAVHPGQAILRAGGVIIAGALVGRALAATTSDVLDLGLALVATFATTCATTMAVDHTAVLRMLQLLRERHNTGKHSAVA